MSKSKRRSASAGSPPPPEFFVDRSLGRYEVPEALRAAGLVVHTMADIYGEDWGQRLDDEVWLADIADAGMVALFKDDAIRRRPAQIAAVEAGSLRCFCLTNAGLKGAIQVEWFLTNLSRIRRAAHKPGPYVYGVYADRIGLLWPRPTPDAVTESCRDST